MKTINWDQYFMGLAKVSAMRSKDPNTKVGACIANSENRVAALGYNGMPHGNDVDFSWEREAESKADTKYPYVIHAEMNAILNANTSVKDGVLYVTLFPCSKCAKFVAQAGIKEIVYSDDKYEDTEDDKIAKHILDSLGVRTRKIEDFEVTIK